MRLFFATDVHGSNRCFTKFVNAAAFYKVDALVLGGDITGKALVPLVRNGGGYRVRFLGEELEIREDAELEAVEARIANTGYYPYRLDADEEAELRGDPERTGSIFRRLIVERVERWMELAAERLGPIGVPCYVNAGNDDPFEIDEVVDAARHVQFLEGRVAALPDGTELVSCGFANRTPWDCPRDVDEPELAERIDAAVSRAADPGKAIFNFHCPPFDSVIDSGPALDEEMRLRTSAGGVEMRPVGSRACREAIETYQPLVGLHGHLHESRGSVTLGRTVCVNPGSEYSEGILRGAIVELRRGKVRNHQLTAG
jgi:uncharacterized protein